MVLMASMQIERPRDGGGYCHNHQLDRALLMESTPPSKFYSNNSSPLVLQPCSFSDGGGGGGGRSSVGGLGHIQHTVSKFDTLVGIAIKYGVEVADIKKMNGLTTDQQVFALKSLQIPSPGRHPPSPIISNRSTGSKAPQNSDLFNSIKSLKLSSSSANSSRGYYGNNTNDHNAVGEEAFEMAVFRKEEIPKPPKTPNSVHRKSKSLVIGLYENNGEVTATTNELDKVVRRRKSEVDLNNSEISVTRNLFSVASKDAFMETLSGVRKSWSTPSFEDSNNNSSLSIWPTSMLNLTADLQAFSTAVAIPMFDGLPKPNSGRKNKAALD